MSAPSLITDLVERFGRNKTPYHSDAYNEAQLRREFIDPFFKTLGWDMDNEQGFAEAYKDVIHEDSIRIGGELKAPDYSFRVGGTRKFFLEAKKPKIFVRDDRKPAFQLRRYAWSAKLPLSILTNFEEFAVYDCRQRPDQNDKSSASRLHYWKFEDYPEVWEQIAAIFSKDAVLRGDFDRYAAAAKGKRGTAEVDDEFLKEIEAWREALAHNMALRNPGLTVSELNFAVAKTIDRLVFLRVCEDRGIEPYEQLKALEKVKGIYGQLFEVFHRADERYNSGLFHFKKESGRTEGPDALTPNLTVDDKILKGIIKSLYYPESPYEFSVFPAEILGQVYEQFLGKVIRLTPAHQAKVEDKPEVKKAGGVYYTPSYIVDYIVQHTVGKLLEDKSPKEAAKLKIVDPACGSGSFLIGAYQYLLDWHLVAYLGSGDDSGGVRTPRPAKKNALPLYQNARGEWRLTLAERKRILLNNIYGVDIDAQAVEVTKLSLLLKVLEGETQDTLQSELGLRLRALPDLSANIKCGNSLIGPDIDDLQPDLSDDERRRINPFDWHAEFPAIFRSGGFDAVIGNPPWGSLFSEIKIYFMRYKYASTNTGTTDSYPLFIEASLNILKDSGILSFITPDTILRKDNFLAIRSQLLTGCVIEELIETGPVFKQVRDTWCLVFRLKNELPTMQHLINHKQISRFIIAAEDRLGQFGENQWDRDSHIAQSHWRVSHNAIVGYLSDTQSQAIIGKLNRFQKLGALREEYAISRGEEGSKFTFATSNRGSYYLVIPEDISRYQMNQGKHVALNSLTQTKVQSFYSKPKIWTIRIQKMRWPQRIVSTTDDRRNSAAMKTCQCIVSVTDNIQSLQYLQGIIASKLINFWCINYLADDMNQSYLEKLPIRTINFSDRKDKARHDGLVKLVEKMLKLQADVRTATLPGEETRLRREIAATDRRIDREVYDLYGLTEDEIKIVEGTE
ncbi:MAG: Eco57I restriction-modification methylase domain-containing protein [Calditrichota bacterium]